MSVTLSEEQATFLREHRLAVLATGRADGSPQVSTVRYDFDGETLVTSTARTSAKWRNVQRQPRVALVINEGRQQLVLYGTVELLPDGEGRRAAMLRLLSPRRVEEARALPPADFDAQLDAEGRVAMRIELDRVLMGE